MPDSIKKSVRVVAFPEGDGWIAQCVEHDICAQGRDLPAVQRNMTAALVAECDYTVAKGGEPFAGIDPAPSYFEAMFEEAEEAALQSEWNFRIAA